MAEAARRDWRRWRRDHIRDPLIGALDIAIHLLARRLPIDWASAIGGRLGVLNGRYRLHAARERARAGYLLLAGAGATAPQAERAVTRLFDNAGRTLLEFSVLDRLWRAGRIAVVGEKHLRGARAAARPILVMGLHLGNWEVIAPSLIGLGFRVHGIYMPPRSRFEDRIALAARERYGLVPLRAGVAAARAAYRLLVEDRELLLIYADDERGGHVNAPLFGRRLRRRANLGTIARLAAASGAAVIPAYVERLRGARFRVAFLPPVDLMPGAGPALFSENVERLDRAIAPLVRDRLDQWYMLFDYRRE